MVRNRRFALVFRVGAFLFSLLGLLSHLGIFSGKLSLGILMYYTVQSNILGVVMFAVLALYTARGLRKEGAKGSAGYLPRFEMVCVIDLLLTLLVYWVMLAPQSFSMTSSYSLFSFDNLAVHLITPLLCMADYVLFTESGHLRYADVWAVLIFPLFYVAFSSAAGFLGYVYRVRENGVPVRFPYFFIDYDQVGVFAVAYIGGLFAFFLLLSHLLYCLDKKVKKPVLLA
ncbi:MAG: Pr6Pr family membrane protein [Oscillospiraceae bacterium]